MSVNYYVVIVDDFTTKALNYPNVSYYDYGTESNITYWDSWYYDYRSSLYPFDYGDIDNSSTNFSNSQYYHISQFYPPTLMETGQLDPVYADYEPYVQDYMLIGYNDYAIYQQLVPYSFGNDDPGHGDWTLEAFFTQIDDINSVEVIAIDIELLGVCLIFTKLHVWCLTYYKALVYNCFFFVSFYCCYLVFGLVDQ